MVALTIARHAATRAGRGGVGLRDAAFGALVAAIPNAGFMGVPLLVALFGDAAAGPVIGAIVDRPGGDQHAVPGDRPGRVGTLAGDAERRARACGADRAARRADQSAAVGDRPRCRAWRRSAWSRWRRSAQIVRMLGDSATPVALFTIGAVLLRAGNHVHSRTPVGRYLPVALIKLVVHPALVFGARRWRARLGAPVPTFGLMILTLTAALPSASNVSVLAERYGANNGRVTRIIMASTILAFVSFSAIAWGFEQGKPGEAISAGQWSVYGIQHRPCRDRSARPAPVGSRSRRTRLSRLVDAISEGRSRPEPG